MNTKTLANHYATLTAEERFRLIQNAIGLGDSAEGDRLANVLSEKLGLIPSSPEKSTPT